MESWLPGKQSKQQGLVLLVSLVVLAVVSVVSASLMQNATQEERMTSEFISRSRVLQSAEVALNKAEKWLSDHVVMPLHADHVTDGVDVWLSEDLQAEREQILWMIEDAERWNSLSEISGLENTVHETSRYLIEELAVVPDAEKDTTQPELVFYRITVSSHNDSTRSEIFLQSTFSRYLYTREQADSLGMSDEQLLEQIRLRESGSATGRRSWRRLVTQ